jgi:hypothetical protein
MSLAFAAAGACEVITGLALRPAAAPGRLILMAGGLAGVHRLRDDIIASLTRPGRLAGPSRPA